MFQERLEPMYRRSPMRLKPLWKHADEDITANDDMQQQCGQLGKSVENNGHRLSSVWHSSPPLTPAPFSWYGLVGVGGAAGRGVEAVGAAPGWWGGAAERSHAQAVPKP